MAKGRGEDLAGGRAALTWTSQTYRQITSLTWSRAS